MKRKERERDYICMCVWRKRKKDYKKIRERESVCWCVYVGLWGQNARRKIRNWETNSKRESDFNACVCVSVCACVLDPNTNNLASIFFFQFIFVKSFKPTSSNLLTSYFFFKINTKRKTVFSSRCSFSFYLSRTNSAKRQRSNKIFVAPSSESIFFFLLGPCESAWKQTKIKTLSQSHAWALRRSLSFSWSRKVCEKRLIKQIKTQLKNLL